jgi:hypothetical protein
VLDTVVDDAKTCLADGSDVWDCEGCLIGVLNDWGKFGVTTGCSYGYTDGLLKILSTLLATVPRLF